jgi:serine/threonine protein kinase/tetratricopeptide (TPR) repeat protein
MRAGEIVAERFRIERVAARGASGVVLSAIDEASGARVALKLLLGELEEASIARFDVETAALRRLAHPAIVGYVAHGRLEGNGAYLAMEWVDGGSLSQRLRSRGLAGRASLAIARRLAEALAAAHAAGIVHRDVKPGNVLLAKDDVSAAKLADFGIARLGGSSTVTTAGTWVGTPRYMPPEQVRDARKVDGRADVFALGCVLFECLTGRNAFPGDDAATTLARILLHERVRLSSVRPDLPDELSTLIAAMLAREARDRPTAAEAVEALERLIAREDPSLELEAPTLGSVHEPAPTLGARTILEVARTLEPETEVPESAWTPTPTPTITPTIPGDPSATPSATPSASRRVPPPETPTIGRDAELELLSRALFAGASGASPGAHGAHGARRARDAAGAIVLWGGPGIGKTRLAIELAQRATGETALCDLGEARDEPGMLDAIARTLDRPRTRGVTLGALLAESRLGLLILDRADHVAAELARALGAPAATGQAQPAMPRLIVTSRVRVRSTRLSPHEVLPLSTAAGSGGTGERSAAGALFHFHARGQLDESGAEHDDEATPSAGLEGLEAIEAIEAIARALDGVPLALELAAANVGVLGLSGIVARRVRPLELVGGDEPATLHAAGERSGGADDNVSMATALWWSWRALGPDEAALAGRCALLRGGFTAEHAEAIAPSSWGPGRALAALRVLRDRSVLARDAARQQGETRLAMYGAVRDFAFARLVERGELADAWARHAEHFARWSAPLAEAVLAGTDASAARTLTAEATNLLAAAEHALALQPPRVPLALRCLAALAPIASERAPLDAFLRLSSAALAGLEALAAPLDAPLEPGAGARDGASTETDRIRVHQARGRFWTLLGEPREGRADLERAVELATRAGDAIALGRARIDLGVARHRDGDVAAAEEHYLAARALLEPAHDDLHVARAIGNVAVVAHDRGELEVAAALYREAIERLERLDDPRVLGNFEMNSAILDQEAGRLGQAKARALRAVELVARTSDLRLLAATYDVLAVLVEEIGALDEALEWHERAIAACERSVERRAEARCRARTATLLARLGRGRAAEEQRRSALRLLRDDDPITQAIVRAQLALMPLGEAEAALARGDRETASRLAGPLAAVLAEAEATSRDPRFAHSSDDLRALVRIHRPAIERLRARG